jgi:hypothetical protein
MDREPIVAGRFYPGSRDEWQPGVLSALNRGSPDPSRHARLAMVPHAAHIFSGGVCGETLAKANIRQTVLLLGPNHSGQGEAMAVWPTGRWHVPGASLNVDDSLAQAIIESHPGFSADTTAHQYEHSLEVVIPFLWALNAETRLVPICISETDPETLKQAGRAVADVVSGYPDPVSVVVSSDMSHFISAEEAKKQDDKALQAILDIDPDRLFEVVRSNRISMCGVLPMTVGLSLAKALEAEQSEMVRYATSGDLTGDYQHVVGYAGAIIW